MVLFLFPIFVCEIFNINLIKIISNFTYNPFTINNLTARLFYISRKFKYIHVKLANRPLFYRTLTSTIFTNHEKSTEKRRHSENLNVNFPIRRHRVWFEIGHTPYKGSLRSMPHPFGRRLTLFHGTIAGGGEVSVLFWPQTTVRKSTFMRAQRPRCNSVSVLWRWRLTAFMGALYMCFFHAKYTFSYKIQALRDAIFHTLYLFYCTWVCVTRHTCKWKVTQFGCEKFAGETTVVGFESVTKCFSYLCACVLIISTRTRFRLVVILYDYHRHVRIISKIEHHVHAVLN